MNESLKYKHWKPYLLIDPRDHAAFYAGITRRPLHTRVTEHVHEAKAGHGGAAKRRRVLAILAAGKRPIIAGLGRVGDDEWQAVERDLIAALRRWNARLTNRAGGGKGNTYLHTPAEKKKISASVARARSGQRAISSS